MDQTNDTHELVHTSFLQWFLGKTFFNPSFLSLFHCSSTLFLSLSAKFQFIRKTKGSEKVRYTVYFHCVNCDQKVGRRKREREKEKGDTFPERERKRRETLSPRGREREFMTSHPFLFPDVTFSLVDFFFLFFLSNAVHFLLVLSLECCVCIASTVHTLIEVQMKRERGSERELEQKEKNLFECFSM